MLSSEHARFCFLPHSDFVNKTPRLQRNWKSSMKFMIYQSAPTTAASLAIAILFTGLLSAEVTPNPLFSDGAVLQRGQDVPVWGTARDGEKVTVELGSQKLTTTAKDGKWRVDLKPLTAGGPFTMTLTGDNTVTVKNLLVGEVWICSGQSNMSFTFNASATAAVDTPKANFPKIRMFTVDRIPSLTPVTEREGSWIEASPETVGKFSAVGYYFALDLYQKIGIPVGMINTSWGGTPAQAWTSIDGFGNAPELQEYVVQAKKALATQQVDPATLKTEVDEYNTAKKAWDENVGNAYMETLKQWRKANAIAKKEGKALPPKPTPSSPAPAAPANSGSNPHFPTTLYNGMVAPLIPYAIKGVIWYQGESNANNSKQYRTLFPAMIADWRTKWKLGDFPFLFVQIAPFNGQPPEIREAQFLTLSKSKNTAMTVITDLGNATNIHPTKKAPVGARLALAARALAYGEKIEYSGPLYQSMKAQGDKVILSFTHEGSGLVAQDGELKGFTIAGADGKFIPAKAEIQGENVIVSAAGVASPKAVRYGWANVPDVNLFNKEGIPASPFRTDVD